MANVPDPPVSAGAHHFQTEHLRDNLEGRSARGGVLVMGSQAAQFVLTIGSVAVLGRLLTPADFGLVAMVIAITGFVGMFKDVGLSLATVQREGITHEQVSTLFWINIAAGFLLAAVTAGLAPAVAWFYREPRLVWVTMAVGATFILSGLAVQHQSLLQRQMRFGVLASINLIAMAAGIAAAIGAAAVKWGYWALVIQVAVQLAVTVAGVWTACRWRPGRPRRRVGVRPLLAFGGQMTGFSLLNYMARNTDNVLVGWRSGADALGFYSKAYQLLLLPVLQLNVPMSSVALPGLSRLQNDPARFKRYYFTAIGLLVFVGMPVVVFLLVEARGVVGLVMGNQWLPAVAMFRALGAAAFVGTFNVAGGWVYVSLGRPDRQLKWAAISVPLTVASFFIGLPWGAQGVAIGFSISQCALFPFSALYCYRGTFLRVRELFGALARPAGASLVAGIILATVQHEVLHLNAYWEMVVIGGAIYGVLYAALWLMIPGGIAQIREYAGILWRTGAAFGARDAQPSGVSQS